MGLTRIVAPGVDAAAAGLWAAVTALVGLFIVADGLFTGALDLRLTLGGIIVCLAALIPYYASKDTRGGVINSFKHGVLMLLYFAVLVVAVTVSGVAT